MSIGLHLPIRRGNGGYFQQTDTPVERAKSNIKNLLLTSFGERPMHPNFGTRLRRMVFDNITRNVYVSEIRSTIEDAIEEWLPDIGVRRVTVLDDSPDNNAISIRVIFYLKQDPNTDAQVDFDI